MPHVPGAGRAYHTKARMESTSLRPFLYKSDSQVHFARPVSAKLHKQNGIHLAEVQFARSCLECDFGVPLVVRAEIRLMLHDARL